VHPTECPRERELLATIVGGRWPAGADPDLVAHATVCRGCAALAELASTLVLERDTASSQACILPSAVVWWRAQLRARQEATRKAARPINAAIGLAFASIAGLAAAVMPLAGGSLRECLAWFGTAMPSVHLPAIPLATGLSSTWSLLSGPVPLALLAAASIWLIAAPFALYWAFSAD
jgi:hypothetical protein